MEKSEELLQGKIDFRAFLYKVLRFKYLYIAVLAICIVFAYFHNKYSNNVYRNTTTILLSSDNNNILLGTENLFRGMGMAGAGNKNIENEIGILSSFSMVNRTIQQLNLEASYYVEEETFMSKLLKNSLSVTREIYNSSPFTVILDRSHVQPIYVNISVELLSNEKYWLTASGTEVSLYNYIDNQVVRNVNEFHIDEEFRFGETVSSDYFSFAIELKDENAVKAYEGKNLYFVLNHMDYLTLQYMANLTVEPTTLTSSLVNVTLRGGNRQKITDFLNQYTTVYLNSNLEKKNKIAQSTVNFIDSQISDIADSLRFAETNLQSFRTSNRVMDLSFQGQRVFDQMAQLENERANLLVQKRYYDYINEYFMRESDGSNLVAPSSMNVVDPLLNELISQLVAATSERNNLLSSGNPKNLYIASLETKMENLKKTILENVQNNQNTLNMSINEIDYRSKKMAEEISRLPRTELQLLGIERKFKLNDAIYTYLLQKRSEAQITRASNTPDYEVIDQARYVAANLVAPKKSLNYMIALFLGLLLPTAFILIKDFLNNKIVEISDIESITKTPITGHIFKNNKNSNTVIHDFPKSAIAESFRAVRTNLQIKFQGRMKQVVLVTSSTSGEGKTFVSINLAASFAVFGARTVLLGFDLRRPTIHEMLGMNNLIGISSYLSDRALLDDIIQPTAINNLDFVTAGPIPANPSELIASSKTRNLIANLKEMYDYIIIDTAPLGAVADSFLLMNYANENLFVVRQNYTHKEALKTSIRSMFNNKISNASILFNDVNVRGKTYTYGYDSVYYSEKPEEENPSFFRRLLKRA